MKHILFVMAEQTNHTAYNNQVLYTFQDGSQYCTATHIIKRKLNLPRNQRRPHPATGETLVLDMEEEVKKTIYYLTRKFLTDILNFIMSVIHVLLYKN